MLYMIQFVIKHGNIGKRLSKKEKTLKLKIKAFSRKVSLIKCSTNHFVKMNVIQTIILFENTFFHMSPPKSR